MFNITPTISNSTLVCHVCIYNVLQLEKVFNSTLLNWKKCLPVLYLISATFNIPRVFNSTLVYHVCICNVLQLEKVGWVVSHACILLTAAKHHRDSIAVSVFVPIFVELDKY